MFEDLLRVSGSDCWRWCMYWCGEGFLVTQQATNPALFECHRLSGYCCWASASIIATIILSYSGFFQHCDVPCTMSQSIISEAVSNWFQSGSIKQWVHCFFNGLHSHQIEIFGMYCGRIGGAQGWQIFSRISMGYIQYLMESMLWRMVHSISMVFLIKCTVYWCFDESNITHRSSAGLSAGAGKKP